MVDLEVAALGDSAADTEVADMAAADTEVAAAVDSEEVCLLLITVQNN